MSTQALLVLLLTSLALVHRNAAAENEPVRIGGTELWLRPPPSPQGLSPKFGQGDFVVRAGHQLAIGNKSFYFLGWNAYWLIDKTSWGHEWGRTQVAELLTASQRLGMTVGRTWAFNSAMPDSDGHYYEKQFEALDFVIYAAGRYGIRVLLALGNLWPAYFGPERWLLMAKGSSGTDGLDILDFYRDSATKELYKKHITTIVNRVNTYTGIKYKHDPAIFGWDVLNEPRCPECPQDIPHTWMLEMTTHLRAVDRHHLILMGTEGFFNPGPENLNQFNPGSGTQCEGEDWRFIGQMPDLDVTTMHVYERHMEKRPQVPGGRSYLANPDWETCSFECYINFLVPYVQLHLEVNARDNGKPMIIEEFGLTWWKSELADLKVLVEVMRQILLNSARTNGSLAGIMFWSAAHNDSDDQDGYNVKIDRWPRPVPSSPVNIKYPIVPPVFGSFKPFVTAYDQPNAVEQFFNHQMPVQSSSSNHGALRRLTWQQEVLDSFRRGWQRGDCAVKASRYWRPMPIDYSVVDVKTLREYTKPMDVVDLLAKITRQLRYVLGQ